MSVSEFNKLLRRNVPHILEKIFLSVDYNTFKKCQEVSKDWKNLLISETFLERGKTIFCEQIRNDLMQREILIESSNSSPASGLM